MSGFLQRLRRAFAAFLAADQAPAPTRVAERVKISPEAVAVSKVRRGQSDGSPFKAAKPAPGVVPDGTPKMAMDWGGFASDPALWDSNDLSALGGRTFFGYPVLSEMAQLPEYRMIVDTIAMEMTREWIEFQSVGEDDREAKAKKEEKIKAIQDEMDRLGVRDVFKRVAQHDGYFGRAHIYLDTGDSAKPEELKKSIGNGRDGASKAKINKGKLKGLLVREPVWVYPQTYNATDPLKADWYKPQWWFILGKEVHASRLLTFVGREVPDLLKPAYAFGGLALTQIARPYVDNWRKTQSSVSDGISAYSVFVLMSNLSESLQVGGEEVFKRLEIFNNYRNNNGVMAVDKDTEDLKNIAAPLTGLDLLQAQAQEHIASVSGIPLVKLLGVSPHGLNASAEPELRSFYERILSFQESFFRPHLTSVIDFVQLSLFGEIDQEITFRFVPLWSLSEKEEAEIREIDARAAQTYVDIGALGPAEVRAKIANDEKSPYHGIDPEEVPDLLREEEEGLEVKGGGSEREGLAA